MSSNICGNCVHFKPGRSDNFFNCTKASHAGVKYGMQVRADTRSCDAFTPLAAPVAPKPAPRPVKAPPKERPAPTGLCPWGRVIIITVIIIAILLISLLAYTCARGLISSPAPTPTPTATSVEPTLVPTSVEPTPTPVPKYIYDEHNTNEWAVSVDQAVYVHSALMKDKYVDQGAPTGTRWLVFKFTITNRGQSKIVIAPGSFWVNDSTGQIYHPPAGKYYYALALNALEIYPGGTGQGELPYLIPTYASGLEINYVLETSSLPAVIAKWNLPW